MDHLLGFLINKPKEYVEGFLAEDNAENPYDFFDEYKEHYDFCIGNQARMRKP